MTLSVYVTGLARISHVRIDAYHTVPTVAEIWQVSYGSFGG